MKPNPGPYMSQRAALSVAAQANRAARKRGTSTRFDVVGNPDGDGYLIVERERVA